MSNISKKHKEILDASANLFKKQGYAATSMRQLAKAVNIEPSSLYSHIQSKEDVLRMICFGQAEKFTQFIHWIKEQDDSPIDKIKAILIHQIQIAHDDPTAITVFNDEWKHLGESNLLEFLKMRKEYENILIDFIQLGMNQGLLKQLNPKIIINILLSSIKWIHFQSDKSLVNSSNYDAIVDLVMDGILVKKLPKH